MVEFRCGSVFSTLLPWERCVPWHCGARRNMDPMSLILTRRRGRLPQCRRGLVGAVVRGCDRINHGGVGIGCWAVYLFVRRICELIYPRRYIHLTRTIKPCRQARSFSGAVIKRQETCTFGNGQSGARCVYRPATARQSLADVEGHQVS